MKALIKSVNFGISLLLILSAIAIAYIAIPAFGNKALIVRSGSMQPAIKVGDLVVVKTQHGLLTPQPISDNPLSSAKISSYKVGETIAFKSQNGSKVFTTHRIVGKEIQEGKVFYRTKGDANDSADENLVAEENVVGKSMFRLPHFGKLFAFAKSNIGFPLLVIFPALLVIILEMVNIYKEIKRQNRLVQVPAPKENFAGLKVIIPVFMSVMVMN
ncbi:signal peptidase I, partial [Candidatus Curtissbacteria bacterium RIFCSPLOWO2_01_FULL_41_28]